MSTNEFDSDDFSPNGNSDGNLYNKDHQRKPRIPKNYNQEGVNDNRSNDRRYDHSAYRDNYPRNDYNSNRYGQNNPRPYQPRNYNPNYRNDNYRNDHGGRPPQRSYNPNYRNDYGGRDNSYQPRNHNPNYRNDNYRNPNYRNDNYRNDYGGRPPQRSYNPNYRNDYNERRPNYNPRFVDRSHNNDGYEQRPRYSNHRNQNNTMGFRLPLLKAIAKMEYASPRICLKAIKDGLVSVNGQVIRNPKVPVSINRDHITINGVPPYQNLDRMYIVVHKQKNYSGSNESMVPSMYKVIKNKFGWFAPMGCLDIGSSGLVIYTNDLQCKQDFGNSIKNAPKTYHIKVHIPFVETGSELQELNEFMKEKLGENVLVDLKQNNTRTCWLSVVVRTSSPKEIRKALKEYGLETLALERYSIGHLNLNDLQPGSWRRLSDLDVGRMMDPNK